MPISSQNQQKFEGYDVPVHNSRTQDIILPAEIRLIESKYPVAVNLEYMSLQCDNGVRGLRLRKQLNGLSNNTFNAASHALLSSLNGHNKASTVISWTGLLQRLVKSFKPFLKNEIETITLEMFLWYEQKVSKNTQKNTRVMLKNWIDANSCGIHKDLRDYLHYTRHPSLRDTLEIQANDPLERPFSRDEVTLFIADLIFCLIHKQIDEQEYFLWRLIVSMAPRPVQMGLLRVEDVRVAEMDFGKIEVWLNIPIIKQQGSAGRDLMQEYRLSNEVGSALQAHLVRASEVNGGPLEPETPLFCMRRDGHGGYSIKKSHTASVLQMMNRTRKTIAAVSGVFKPDDLFARRYKHTKLTHMAINGASIEVMAREAFHKTKESLRRYTNLTEEAYVEYERLLEKEHKSIGSMFHPTLVDRESPNDSDDEHKILAPNLVDDLGSCGGKVCRKSAKFGCYLCYRFKAFRDGEHQSVLSELESKKKVAIMMKLSIDTITRDDELINAVKQVIANIESGE